MRTSELSYLQLSGRAQALSEAVLPREMLERMAEAQSAAEALRTLAENGVAPEEGLSAAAALRSEEHTFPRRDCCLIAAAFLWSGCGSVLAKSTRRLCLRGSVMGWTRRGAPGRTAAVSSCWT